MNDFLIILIILIILYIAFVFGYQRMILNSYMEYVLTPKSIKSMKENIRFWEWILYTRFYRTIPKGLLYAYYFYLLLYPIEFAVCLFMQFTNRADFMCDVVVVIVLIHGLYAFVFEIFFGTLDIGRFPVFER